MDLKVKVGISNRHVHLTEEVYEQLFDVPLEKLKDLKQPLEFASNMCVTIKSPVGEIKNVRILGPFRSYCQVEVSYSDAFKLGLNPPVRKSGDLVGATKITLVTDKGEVTLNEACILAEAHIHMSQEDLESYGFQDNAVVPVEISGPRKGIIYAHVKASEQGVLEFHVDRDEANAFLLVNDQEVNVKL